MHTRASSVVWLLMMACSTGESGPGAGVPEVEPVTLASEPAASRAASTEVTTEVATTRAEPGTASETVDTLPPASTPPVSTPPGSTPPASTAADPAPGRSEPARTAIPEPGPAPATPTTTVPPAATAPATDGGADSVTDGVGSGPPVPEPAKTLVISLEPSRSWLYVLLRYDRNAWVKGHDHGIKATTFDGRVRWNADDASQCAVDISFPVTALAIDTTGLRPRIGLEGETDEGDKGKIKDNMLGKSQLNSSSFPRISYKAVKCEGTTGVVRVTGDLTIRGTTKRLTVPLQVTLDRGEFHAQGKFSAAHSDFGFDPFTAALGALRNDDTLTFFLDLRGKAQ